MTRTEAIAYLNKRYTEQAERFPLLEMKVGRKLYVKRNLKAAMELGKVNA